LTVAEATVCCIKREISFLFFKSSNIIIFILLGRHSSLHCSIGFDSTTSFGRVLQTLSVSSLHSETVMVLHLFSCSIFVASLSITLQTLSVTSTHFSTLMSTHFSSVTSRHSFSKISLLTVLLTILQAFLGTFWQTSLGTCLQSCLLQKKNEL